MRNGLNIGYSGPQLRGKAAGVVLCATLLLGGPSAALSRGGFKLDGARVPPEEILAGGPGKDGIKSVDAPEFVAPEEASWVVPKNPVLGVAVGEEAHVYPIHLIEYHQVVNDHFGKDKGVPVVVTYDPLAGTPRAWKSRVDGRALSFGVSGLLYNDNFLLYDRETGSLWLQLTGEALAGPLAGKHLAPVTIRQETLTGWLARFPRSRVLVRPMPKQIDYRYSPFSDYILANSTPFPVKAKDTRFHMKEMVLGVVVDGQARAYLGSIATAAGGQVEDVFRGKKIRFVYDSPDAVFSWDVPDGVHVCEAYWLAWKAFHPDTDVWRPASAAGSRPSAKP